MPLYDFICNDCGKSIELLVKGLHDTPICSFCGSQNLKKQLSALSSASGVTGNRFPGAMDTACCGSTPGQAAGCAGPGSCCGKNQ